MKKTVGMFVVLCGTLSLVAAEYSDVAVRQLWPFSRNVEVSFTAANVSGFQKLTIGVKEGEKLLGTVPVVAYRGTSGVVGATGRYRLEFDPTAVSCLSARGMCKDFSVTLESAPLNPDEALYLIFDLTKQAGVAGQREVVTTEALKAGVWGDWVDAVFPEHDEKGSYTNNLTKLGAPVWTGVAKDEKYALTHLVLRRIPAGSFKMGYAASADVGKGAPNIVQREVALTKPYYIGIYPVTRKQLRLMTGSTNQDSLNYPTVSDTFDQIRGAYTTAGGPYDWPTDKTVDPNSFIGKFRARTGAALDLPTEAQWEKAARAGSAGVYYDGCEQTHAAERNAIAWNTSNAGATIHPVGQLKPNNYGLYDVLGNCWEWVLDWMAGAVDIELTDPEGPTAAGSGYWSGNVPKRMLKGAAYTCDYKRVTLYERTQNPVNAGAPDYGWRLAMPTE